MISVICLAALSACTGAGMPSESGLPDEQGEEQAEGASLLDLPDTPYTYANNELPAYFHTPYAESADNTSAENPITDDGATLGRVLF